MHKSSASLIIREIQMKTTMKYHLTRSEWPSSKNLQTVKCWRGCGGKGTLLITLKLCGICYLPLSLK